MNEVVFEAEHVTKRFDDVAALWNVSVSLAGPSLIVAQALHWRRLRRYFLTGDLVGASD